MIKFHIFETEKENISRVALWMDFDEVEKGNKLHQFDCHAETANFLKDLLKDKIK